jgi:hypothetical protein
MNTQAYRNFMFSNGNSSDSNMELFFRNRKGTKEESAKLKKGSIHDSLSETFVFQTIRVSHVAQELSKLMSEGNFMDTAAPKKDTYRKSTMHRWIDNVRFVYTHAS